MFRLSIFVFIFMISTIIFADNSPKCEIQCKATPAYNDCLREFEDGKTFDTYRCDRILEDCKANC